MRMEEAVVAMQKAANEMTDAAERAGAATIRYQAHMNLYNAASTLGDKDEMEAQRLAIHAQVDAILDAGYQLHFKQREFRAIQRNVTN